jgi:hypothetical protein
LVGADQRRVLTAVAVHFTSGNGLQFKPFPATDEDLSHAVDAGPLDEKRRIYHKPSEEYVKLWVDEILTRQALSTRK